MRRPTSTRLFWPVSATRSASSRSSTGRSRLRASRLPVPPGSSPIGVSLPTIASATARTVPSPPSGQTRSTPLAEGLLGLPGAGVALGGQDEQRLGPAVVDRLLGDPPAHRRHVVELGGVDDDRGATSGGVGHGALRAEVVAVRAAPPPAAPVGAAGAAHPHPGPPGDAEGEQDDEDDRPEGDPAGVFVKHGPTLPHGRGGIGTGQRAGTVVRPGAPTRRRQRIGRIPRRMAMGAARTCARSGPWAT